MLEILDPTNNRVQQESDIIWPPYSPGFNPFDFFLWGHLKDLVHRDCPAIILKDLKDSISNHIKRVNIDKDLYARVIKNFKKRPNYCLECT